MAGMRRSDLLREIAIRSITQAFLSVFTAAITAMLAVTAVIVGQLLLSAVLESWIVTWPSLFGLILAIGIVSAKLMPPLWLLGNAMLALCCMWPFFRRKTVWSGVSVAIAAILSFETIGSLPDVRGILMLALYACVLALAFRCLNLRLTLGIWADLRSPPSASSAAVDDGRTSS